MKRTSETYCIIVDCNLFYFTYFTCIWTDDVFEQWGYQEMMKIRHKNKMPNVKVLQRMKEKQLHFCTFIANQNKSTRRAHSSTNKKLIRKWDSERELSLRRHCTRSKNTIDSCINSATDRFVQHKLTKFSEITQCNGHYAVQGHSRSPISVVIESSYTTSY